MGQSPDQARLFLSTLPPERRDKQLALAAVLASVAFFIVAVPFAKVQLAKAWAFIPIYESALIISDVLTAALLIGQYNILRSRALLALASGYMLTALAAIAHMLTFPGLFAPNGLLGAGPQTTAWLYMFWHAGFPLAVMAYARLTPDLAPSMASRTGGLFAPVAKCGLAILVAVGVVVALTTAGHERLPPILDHELYTNVYIAAIVTVVVLTLAALVAVACRRPRSVLDLWLMVVLCAWLFDIALSAALNHRRFDLGFYAGRIYGLLAASSVLIVLTFENVRLYARIVGAFESEQAERRLVQQRTAELNEAKALLEQRVLARTAALAASNHDLTREVAERKRAEQAVLRSQEELRELAAISSSAREQEKRRIARELHDGLAQTLATLRLELDRFAEKLSAASSVPDPHLADMRGLADEAVASTRRIAADLRPAMLDDLGLAAAVQWLVQSFSQRYGIDCALVLEPDEFDLDEPYASTAYRIVQEALANVARHAQASHVEISVIREEAQIALRISDNGIGFDLSARRKPDSFGLAGLRERAYLVAGQLSIETSPGRGTTIDVRVPLPAIHEPAATP
ncbi:MASE4 domain-containing protein [Trinickia sp. LjRoot230]|uniref:sensor histidine kinase n=1 Tax=Trinickia sp. LjRoot230 TaxID=3342288 RepID=UPI003ECC79E5